MSSIVVKGGHRLEGAIRLHGAKNSALPLLAATIISAGKSIIHNCPELSDVDASIKILQYLGCNVIRSGSSVEVDTAPMNRYDIPDYLMREMRSSIIFLGAIAARVGRARVSLPGGCELGPRPIDLHIRALREMGMSIQEEYGVLDCSCSGGLQGRNIVLSFPSVGATENIMLAAVKASGITQITNAAREPEIVDLAAYLISCGAKIHDAGCGTVTIEGVSDVHGCEHRVIPDRIACITYMAAAAVTGGNIELHDTEPAHIGAVIPVFEDAGCTVRCDRDIIYMKSPERLSAIKTVRTMPYPGFPTDAQAPILAMVTVANGTSIFIENIFSNRYKHVGELMRLGAQIKVEDRVAVVEGVHRLSGTAVEATDLRGGAALVVAGLAAEGQTIIGGVHHISRGYERLEHYLSSLGAQISRLPSPAKTY